MLKCVAGEAFSTESDFKWLNIVSGVLKDIGMQGSREEQLRALRTLACMSKQRASAVPVTVVQQGFHALGAFKTLISLLKENESHGQVWDPPPSTTF
jgi:hypothetical protein